MHLHYRKNGSYSITATYYTGKEAESYNPALSLDVKISECFVIFELDQLKENLTLYKADSFILSSYLNIDCDLVFYSSDDLDVSLSWSVRDCASEELRQEFPLFTGVSIKFSGDAFSLGCNLIRAQLTVKNQFLDLTRQTNKQRSIIIEKTPLKVRITGGILTSASKHKGWLNYFKTKQTICSSWFK